MEGRRGWSNKVRDFYCAILWRCVSLEAQKPHSATDRHRVSTGDRRNWISGAKKHMSNGARNCESTDA